MAGEDLRAGGGGTPVQAGEGISLPSIIGGSEETYTTEVLTGGTHEVEAEPAKFAEILRVHAGGIDIKMPDGRVEKNVKEFNGKPTVRKITESAKKKKKELWPGAGNALGEIGDAIDRIGGGGKSKDRYEVNPELGVQTTNENGVVKQRIEVEKRKTKQKDNTKTVKELLNYYPAIAQDADPAKRQEFRDLQDKLYKGGFYGTTKPIPGIADDAFQHALDEALRTAIRQGETLDEVLAHAVAANPNGPDDGRAPFVGQVSDEASLKETVRKVSTIVAGQYLPPEVLEDIWRDYQAMELANQRLAYDMGGNEGGTVSKTPSFEQYATQRVREADPVKAGAQDLAARAEEFYKLLGVGVSGVGS